MPTQSSFRFRAPHPDVLPPTAPFTLFFDLRPDINSGSNGDTSVQTITINGTSLGTFTSPGANAAGPAAWGQRSAVVTAYVTVGSLVHVTTQFSSGQDTGYFRNMYIQDANGTKYMGGYPNGSIYPDDVQQTGGTAGYSIAQGAGAPNQYSVTTGTWVSPSEGDNKGHYYIPATVFA